MKTLSHLSYRNVLSVAFACASMLSIAQCPFDPIVTPPDLILCPNTQDSLFTQVYDSYQWYKDGSPIPGATGQGIAVDAFNDAGSQFSVAATLAGCTEMSPQVLVDGWAFLPPTVMTTGADFLYITPDYAVYCESDTVLLVMMPPYDTNIQWTESGIPIPGATDDTLVITALGGQFSVSGAPAICPDFNQPLGLSVGISFIAPVQPDILASGSQLCADPPGDIYQWYLDGLPLPGGTTECISATAGGNYVVDVTYTPDCSIPSDPYLVTGLAEVPALPGWTAYPSPADDHVIVRWGDGSSMDRWSLFDATGREVLSSGSMARSPLTIDVSTLGAGRYWLDAGGRATLPVSVAR